MNMSRKCRNLTAAVVLTSLCNLSIGLPLAQAGMIGTETVISAQQSASERDELKALLARNDVRDQLLTLGADPNEVSQRIDSLTPEELASVHQRLDQLPAGGDGVVGAIVFIFLVLLFTDILGLTDVFTFVKKRR